MSFFLSTKESILQLQFRHLQSDVSYLFVFSMPTQLIQTEINIEFK